MPMPPSCAMAMARRASVTVSIAADTSGMFSWMLRDRRVARLVSRGRTWEYAGTNNTSSKVSALPRRRMGKAPDAKANYTEANKGLPGARSGCDKGPGRRAPRGYTGSLRSSGLDRRHVRNALAPVHRLDCHRPLGRCADHDAVEVARQGRPGAYQRSAAAARYCREGHPAAAHGDPAPGGCPGGGLGAERSGIRGQARSG